MRNNVLSNGARNFMVKKSLAIYIYRVFDSDSVPSCLIITGNISSVLAYEIFPNTLMVDTLLLLTC